MTDITLTTDTTSPEPKRMKVRMVEGVERRIPFRDGLPPRNAANLTPDRRHAGNQGEGH